RPRVLPRLRPRPDRGTRTRAPPGPRAARRARRRVAHAAVVARPRAPSSRGARALPPLVLSLPRRARVRPRATAPRRRSDRTPNPRTPRARSPTGRRAAPRPWDRAAAPRGRAGPPLHARAPSPAPARALAHGRRSPHAPHAPTAG